MAMESNYSGDIGENSNKIPIDICLREIMCKLMNFGSRANCCKDGNTNHIIP